MRSALAGENPIGDLTVRDPDALAALLFEEVPDVFTRAYLGLRLADMRPQLREERELAVHKVDMFHTRREIAVDRATSGEAQAQVAAMGALVMFGAEVNRFSYDGAETARFWSELVDGKITPAFELYDMCMRTGQFHSQHLDAANDLVQRHFYAIPEIDGKFFHGRDTDLAARVANYHGQDYKIRMAHVYSAPKPVLGHYLGTGFLHYKQQPTTAGIISTALDRYGAQNYRAIVMAMTPLARSDFLRAEEEHYGQILDVLDGMLLTSQMTDKDVGELYAKHGIEFMVDQYGKGSMQRYVTLSDFLIAMNVMNQGMKKQEKFPSGMAYPYGNKGGQPVVTTRPGWMYVIAAHMRVLTEMVHSILGPRIQIMGPNWSIDRLIAKLGPMMNFLKLFGFDVRKCDSSHRESFIFAMKQLLVRHFPLVSVSWFEFVLGFVYNCMSEWFTRTLDGSFSATVWGQLASGMAWTFFWNCMWSIYNFISLMIKRAGFVAAKRASETMVLMAAGDDGGASFWDPFPEFAVSEDGDYVSELGAELKIEVRQHAFEFCHMAITCPTSGVGPSAHVDLIRTLGKALTRGTVKGVEEFEEMKCSIYALVKRYRDPTQLASSILGMAAVHAYGPEDVRVAADLLHRFCNTPAKRLHALARPVWAVPVEFA